MGDFWKYDLTSHTYSQIALTGVADTDYPFARGWASMAYAGGRTIVLYGGHVGSSTYSDTWEYNTSNGSVDKAACSKQRY